MRFNNLRGFEKHLESAAPQGHFAPVYLLLSKEPYPLKQAIHSLNQALNAKQALSQRRYDASQLDLRALQEDLYGMGLFSNKQIIIIRQIEELIKDEMKLLEGYLANPSPDITLIMVGAALNHSTNFYKKMEKLGVTLELPDEKPWEREKSIKEWLVEWVTRNHKRIDVQAAQFIVKQLGTDQTLLESELEKLVCYVGERTDITIQDIAAVTSSVNIETVWQLGEALFKRDGATALRIGKALVESGTPFLSLLRQLRTQFQTQYQICTLLHNGGSTSDVAQQYPYMKGQILDRNVKSAIDYGKERFRKGMLLIDEMEIMAKNGSTDGEFLADLLILKLVA